MDFEANEEQRMLCEAARKFFAREFPLTRVREVEADGLSNFLPVYRKMGELGFLALGIPEETGGVGGDWLDLTLFAEEAGRALVPVLPITSVALGMQVLLKLLPGDTERVAAFARGQAVLVPAWLEGSDSDQEPPSNTRAAKHEDGVRIDGKKRFVHGLELASQLLVPVKAVDGGVGFALVPPRCAGISARSERLSSLDVTHEVSFDGVVVPREALFEAPWTVWLEAIDGAKIVAAGWAVGAGRAALELAVQYVKDRKQFGRPIGSFQAVQHRLADAVVALEQASALTRYAAWLRASRLSHAREAAMAKLQAGRAICQVTYAATLAHGGYGFMQEFDIQLYFRRAKLLEQVVEGPATQRELIASNAGADLLRVH